MAERRKKKMTDDELAALIRQQISRAAGYDDDELSSNREAALRYYYGKPRGDEIAGRSQVQSLDVADMVEAVMSELMPGIENDDLCAFVPNGPDDIDQAALESRAVNHMIMGQNDGYMLFEQAFHDALLLKNGWAKVWIEEEQEAITHTFQGIDPIAAVELAESGDENTEVEVLKQEQSEDSAELLDVTLRITTTSKKLRVGVVDPTLMCWQDNWPSSDITGIGFIAEKDFPTRSDLILEGYDKKTVYELPATSEDTKGDTQARRSTSSNNPFYATEPSMESVERYTCYAMVDFDGDGIAELREIQIVDNTILHNEPADMRAHATGSPFPQPHRVEGLSLYDKLKSVQDIKTATLRNYVDNMSANNNRRVAVRDGTVDMDDMTNSRPGGIIRCSDPQSDLRELQLNDTGSSNIQLLDYADKMRSERGGASLDLQSAQAQIQGDTAHGIERQYSAREKLAGRMARNLAQTLVKQIFLLTHQAMRLYLRGPIVVREGDQWLETNPAEWDKREAVVVKSGMTLAERNQQLNAISAVYMQQKELMATGQEGILVTLDQCHNALVDMTRAAGIDDVQRYWTNPATEQAQARMQQNQQQQAMMAQQQQEREDKLLAVQKAIEDTKAQVDLYTAKLDAYVDLVKIGQESERAEAEIVANAITKLETAAIGGGRSEANRESSNTAR